MYVPYGAPSIITDSDVKEIVELIDGRLVSCQRKHRRELTLAKSILLDPDSSEEKMGTVCMFPAMMDLLDNVEHPSDLNDDIYHEGDFID